ncbi:hypothetical protein VTK73DRAFT_7203 [Phialemonium thermophilum]|uniref:Uncharacterized protein n=1 Tax=Phialemonium thermophilum TaxID=223376 RepID=A0ABR3WFV9_9PEZI
MNKVLAPRRPTSPPVPSARGTGATTPEPLVTQIHLRRASPLPRCPIREIQTDLLLVSFLYIFHNIRLGNIQDSLGDTLSTIHHPTLTSPFPKVLPHRDSLGCAFAGKEGTGIAPHPRYCVEEGQQCVPAARRRDVATKRGGGPDCRSRPPRNEMEIANLIFGF